MGGWNINSGSSIHSELLGRELAKNNELVVMSFYKYSFHGTAFTGDDEDYVIRCFTRYGDKRMKLDSTPFLKEDYDIFIVEDLGMLPISQLAKIFPKIKKKAKTINVIHDGKISSKPSFYNFEWDAVVCFDKRYKNFVKKKYPENKIKIIPYPAIPLTTGNKKLSKKQLGLPDDKKIVFLFGESPGYIDLWWRGVNNLGSKYDILLLIVTKNKESISKIRELQSSNCEIELRKKFLNIEELYQYLHASDVLIFPKPSRPHVVVSSTIFQCMGSLCPIVAYDSNYVTMFSDEIFKYKNNKELELYLTEIFEKGEKYKKLISSVKKYLSKCSSVQVAKMFERLFLELFDES